MSGGVRGHEKDASVVYEGLEFVGGGQRQYVEVAGVVGDVLVVEGVAELARNAGRKLGVFAGLRRRRRPV